MLAKQLMAVSDAGWAALASMVSAVVSAISLVILTVLRRENTQQHAENAARFERSREEVIQEVKRDVDQVNATLARHAQEELERYSLIMRAVLHQNGIVDPEENP